jgi:hypothetical protein
MTMDSEVPFLCNYLFGRVQYRELYPYTAKRFLDLNLQRQPSDRLYNPVRLGELSPVLGAMRWIAEFELFGYCFMLLQKATRFVPRYTTSYVQCHEFRDFRIEAALLNHRAESACTWRTDTLAEYTVSVHRNNLTHLSLRN